MRFYAVFFILFASSLGSNLICQDDILEIRITDNNSGNALSRVKIQVCYTYSERYDNDCDIVFTDITGKATIKKRSNKPSPLLVILFNLKGYEQAEKRVLWDSEYVKGLDNNTITQKLFPVVKGPEEVAIDNLISEAEASKNNVDYYIESIPDRENSENEELRQQLRLVSNDLNNLLDSLQGLKNENKLLKGENYISSYKIEDFQQRLHYANERVRQIENDAKSYHVLKGALNLTVNSNFECIAYSEKYNYFILKFQILDASSGAIITNNNLQKPLLSIALKKEESNRQDSYEVDSLQVFELLNSNFSLNDKRLENLPLRRLNNYRMMEKDFYDFSINRSGFITAVIVLPEEIPLSRKSRLTFDDYLINFFSYRVWYESNGTKSIVIEPFELSDLNRSCKEKVTVPIDYDKILDAIDRA